MATGKNNYYTNGKNIGLMFIEPKFPATKPIRDELTARTEKLYSLFVKHGPRMKGVHTCVCGKHSDNATYGYPSKYKPTKITNSLLVHYVECHRKEIPEDEMSDLLALLDSVNL